jgi:acyl dehydratase
MRRPGTSSSDAMMRTFAVVANDRAPEHNDPRFARAASFDSSIIQSLLSRAWRCRRA